MKSIDEHIKKDQSEIEAARASGDQAKERHLTDELHSLEEYKEHILRTGTNPPHSSFIAMQTQTPTSAASTTTEPSSHSWK